MRCSIRFGWRWLNGNLELHWFKHEGSEFIFEKIKNIEIDKPVNLEIDIIEFISKVDIQGKELFSDDFIGNYIKNNILAF